MTGHLLPWCAAHERSLILWLAGIALILRGLLLANAPDIGYVWDFYHEGVRILAREGRLPIATDCWQCYHPPLFYLAGWPFFVVGTWLGGDESSGVRAVTTLSFIGSAVTAWFCYRLLRLIGCRGAVLVIGLAVAVASPLLFISAAAPEADIVVTAILSAFLYYLTRASAGPAGLGPRDAVLLGVLAGLAAATKYSGLVAMATTGVVLVLQVVIGPSQARRRAAGSGLLIAMIAGGIGGWKYVDNWRVYGTLLHANGSASDGLTLDGRRNQGHYEFSTVRLGALAELFGPRPVPGDLTVFPVYRSVITTLHAQAWSDMSFFSVPSRHGDASDPYTRRFVPKSLTMSVIVLGFVPEVLALMGVVLTIRRRLFRPMAVLSVITIATYVAWFLPQETWALKTKYVLCLLGPMVAYMTVALAWIWRRVPAAGLVTALLLVALAVLAQVYNYAFAMGRL